MLLLVHFCTPSIHEYPFHSGTLGWAYLGKVANFLVKGRPSGSVEFKGNKFKTLRGMVHHYSKKEKIGMPDGSEVHLDVCFHGDSYLAPAARK